MAYSLSDMEYENEINNNLINKISEFLKVNSNGVSTKIISERLNVKEFYIEKILRIWEKNYCTFFSLGRISLEKNTNLWYYINSNHPNSRKKNIFDNNLILSSNKLNNISKRKISDRIKILEDEISRLKLERSIKNK